MRYRHFRNTDPPALAALWNESLTHRGAVELRSAAPLDGAVLNKPYFDPAGLIVAEEDDKLVGFAHGGFGPNEDLTELNHSVGVLCAVAVRPDRRRQKIGTELVRRVEAYLAAGGHRHCWPARSGRTSRSTWACTVGAMPAGSSKAT